MSEHILVVNGSPRAQRGTTGIVVNQFLKGCHEAGATSEIIEVARSELRFCAGELSCFFKTDNPVCRVHKRDQGAEFAEKWAKADRIVLASPLHFNTVTAHLMRFLERLICLSDPLYTENDGYPTHKGPYDSKPSAVIGVCAYPGISNFNLFKEVMLNYQKVFWLEPGGALLVPMSRDLTVLNETNPRYAALQEVMGSIAQAGREFMTHNEIAMETEDSISRDTDDLERLHSEFDGYFLKLNNQSKSQREEQPVTFADMPREDSWISSGQ
ncbi:MAG: flavodoxin family protein [Pseudomonadota bacterium]